jgi:predicted MFS family arabinose efflux permease
LHHKQVPIAERALSESGKSAGDSQIGPPSRIVAIFLCGVFAFLDLYCTQPLLPLLARVFHASETRAGLTISASTLGVALSAVLLAIFGERFNRKRLIVYAMAALAVTAALTATASSLPILALWRFAQGLITPGIFIITIAYVTEEWLPLQVPRVMSVYVAGSVFGGFVGRVAGGFLAARYGWQAMFLMLGIGGALGAAVTARLLKPAAAQSASSPQNLGRTSLLRPLMLSARNPRLLVTFGIGFCMLFTLVATFSYITFYLAAPPFGLSSTALSALFTVYLVGLVVTLLIGTRLAKLGLRRGMMGAIALCLLGTGCTLIPSLIAVGLGLALTSSGVFIAQTCANSFLRDAAPEGTRVSAAGLYIFSYYIGGTVGGIVPGLLWPIAGWTGAAVLIGLCLLAAGTLTFFGWRSRSTAREPIPLG